MLTPATSKLGRKYGLKPTPPDHPHLMRVPTASVYGAGGGVATFPRAIPGFTCDYRPMFRPPRDQGQKGSCGPHAWTGLKEHNCVQWQVDKGGPADPLGGYLSPEHAYWLFLEAEGQWPSDAGTDNATAASCMQSTGPCPEAFLPYSPDAMVPGNAQCNVAGKPYRIRLGIRVPLDENHIDAVLASKRVIVLGFEVYEPFEETGPDGMVPDNAPGDGLLGGHDVLIVGKVGGRYIIRNSWGTGWGDGGYCYMTPAYVATYGMDAWTSA